MWQPNIMRKYTVIIPFTPSVKNMWVKFMRKNPP
jgi:hypothetical protein